MSDEIARKLDLLANLQAQLDVFNLQKQELIDQVLTPEIKARLDEIEAEFSGKAEIVLEKIAALEEEIKNDVAQSGASVRGAFLQATYYRGRITWDTGGLDRYAQSNPEIVAFRKQGKPYTSIRKI
jgi:hypothetical protein